MKFEISASIMCADPLNMQRDLDILEKNKIDYFHCDIMDGSFVPNLMLSTQLCNVVSNKYQTPLDIHLMVNQPENVIPWFDIKPKDIVSVHYESTPHIQRALSMIRERGASAGLVINPATPLECIREVLPDISVLTLMTVNPGFASQKLIPETLNKIQRCRTLLDQLGYIDQPIEVDGNCSLINIPKMAAMGANVFVVGTSSVFDKNIGIERGIKAVREILRNC